ncbi:MAG: AAA family ATPase, partial [Ilumatobacteraceae bacterium]
TDAAEDASALISDMLATHQQFTEGGALLSGIGTPEQVIARYAAPQRLEAIADQARRDPEWKYAHIVVDEAQDVTPMQWRALARRSQNRSMTIVGDPDQMSRPTDEPWIERITSALGIESCDQRSLHINYRTPADVVRPAHDLRAHHQSADAAPATTYVREGTVPWAMTCAALDDATLRTAIEHARQQLGDRGRLAVISSTQDAATTARVIGALEGHDPVAGARRLLQPVASYLANEVKGLEFDAVVVVDPSAIADEFGWRQLYVVLTRPTTQLGIITVGDHAPFEHAWFETGTVRALG